MSLEWYGSPLAYAILLPAIGHFYHFVLSINVTSSLGLRQAHLDRFRLGLLAFFVASSVLLLWGHLNDPWWNWRWPWLGYAAICVFSGGVIFPLSSLNLALRKRPHGIAGRSPSVDLREGCGTSALIGHGRRGWELRLPGNEAFTLRKREWELAFADLPAELDGLAIVQISDLHMSPSYSPLFFKRVIDACRDWTADLLVITGDLVEDAEAISWIVPVLEPLESRLGKFAILGNHDMENEPERILESLASAGFESLEGRWISIETSGARLALAGTSAPWGPAPESSSMPTADFRLLLSHSPDQFYRACTWGVDLMLSGHNHGGQVRIPGIGPLFMPSRYSRRFDRGFFRSGGTLMYVSEGVGGTHPARYGCPPEVCRFVLRRSTPGPTVW
jgi:predicted MPP superfamily phosphohydrolase